MLAHVPTYFGHVNGNRFLLADMREHLPEPAEKLGHVSKKICQSPLVDDFIVIDGSAQARVRIRIFGGDGHEADFCGNGVLFTLGVLARESSPLLSKQSLRIETASGIKSAILGTHTRHQVDIAPVKTIARDFSVLAEQEGVAIHGLQVAGEPHLLLTPPKEMLVPQGFKVLRFEEFARRIAQYVEYPGGVNVTAVFSVHHHQMVIKTFERGVQRMTASCGSAAVAAASFFLKNSDGAEIERSLVVCSPGGSHLIQNNTVSEQWWLSGEPVITGSGPLSNFIDLWRME